MLEASLSHRRRSRAEGISSAAGATSPRAATTSCCTGRCTSGSDRAPSRVDAARTDSAGTCWATSRPSPVCPACAATAASFRGSTAKTCAHMRARQLYNNISMLFLFPVIDGKLSTGVNATFDASCYG